MHIYSADVRNQDHELVTHNVFDLISWVDFPCESNKTLSFYFFIQSIRPLLGPGKTFNHYSKHL